MRLEREWELEEAKFTSKLFKNAVFKGGGGGGTQSTNTVQKADPWSGQQPFLTDVFQEAQDRYNQGDSPSFFPGSTIAEFNPNELAYQQNVLNQFGSGNFQNMQQGAEGAVGNLFAGNDIYNATGGLAPYGQESLVAASNFTDSQVGDTTNASPLMQQMLSGSVQQNPFIEQANNAMAADAVSNFQQQVMPAIRASQIGYQPGGSSRGDIATGIAAGNVGRSIADFANTNRMNAFNSAQQQQMQAAQLLEGGRGQRAGEALQQGTSALGLGLGGQQQYANQINQGLGAYGTVSQNPYDIAGNVNDIGMTQREMAQQQLDEDINRFQFDQNVQDQKLSNYANLIQGNYGGTTTSSASRGGLGIAGSLGQLGGSVAALGGLIGG